MVCKTVEGIMCDFCETWFHCKCQEVSDGSYKVFSNEKIHFYCSRCDKVVGKIPTSMSELHLTRDKLEEKVMKVEEGLTQVRGERLVCPTSRGKWRQNLRKLETSCKRLSEVLEKGTLHKVVGKRFISHKRRLGR
jgi:hypothetical protein